MARSIEFKSKDELRILSTALSDLDDLADTWGWTAGQYRTAAAMRDRVNDELKARHAATLERT